MKRYLKFSLFSVALMTTSMLIVPESFAFYGEMIWTPSPCCPPPLKILRDGLYLGLGLGYDAYRIRQTSSVTDEDGDTFNINPVLGPKGWMGNTFAGYGRYFGLFYIGGEILANGSIAKTGYAMTSAEVNYRTRLNV